MLKPPCPLDGGSDALQIDEKALGPDHPDLATDLNNLAVLYNAQGKYAEAARLYERSLAIKEKVLGTEHPSLAKEFEKLLLGRRLHHGGNPVLRWMASNVTVKMDAAGNIKPDKGKSSRTG